VKRLVIEIPIQDRGPASELELVNVLLKQIPSAAGLPVVVFGTQSATDFARQQDVPFEVYSVDECMVDDDELSGPLILMNTGLDQAESCKRIVDAQWTGRLVLAVNAGGLAQCSLLDGCECLRSGHLGIQSSL
jgi:hypothetical protein